MRYHSITNINLFSRYKLPVYVLLHIFKYKEKKYFSPDNDNWAL